MADIRSGFGGWRRGLSLWPENQSLLAKAAKVCYKKSSHYSYRARRTGEGDGRMGRKVGKGENDRELKSRRLKLSIRSGLEREGKESVYLQRVQ